MYHASLSTTAKLKVFSIIEESLSVRTELEFKSLLEKIKSVFGQEMAACGIGDVCSLKVIATVNVGFSTDFMAEIVDSSGQMRSPLFQQWLKNHSPKILNLEAHSKTPLLNDIILYNNFSLRNVMAHGVVECDQRYATYFGFAQIPEKLGSHHVRLLSILAPHLHMAYTRLSCVRTKLLSIKDAGLVDDLRDKACGNDVQYSQHANMEGLSARELEVLKWLHQGKANWDIGKIMHISEYTVKNHVQNILKKLKVNSRQHAVAKALHMRLVKL